MDKNKKHIHLGVFFMRQEELVHNRDSSPKINIVVILLYNTLGFRAFLQFPVL